MNANRNRSFAQNGVGSTDALHASGVLSLFALCSPVAEVAADVEADAAEEEDDESDFHGIGWDWDGVLPRDPVLTNIPAMVKRCNIT